MKPLVKEEFADALVKGLGRAVIHVRDFWREEDKAILLVACVKNLSYDDQCEEGREFWLWSQMKLMGVIDDFRAHLFSALSGSDDFSDIHQIVRLVEQYAANGDTKAKEIIYAFHKSSKFNETWLTGEPVIRLGGLEGLFLVMQSRGKRMKEDPDDWENIQSIVFATGHFGEEAVNHAIEQWKRADSDVALYMSKVKECMDREPSKSIKPLCDLESALDAIENKTYINKAFLARFGQHDATKEDLAKLYELLQDEHDHEKLSCMLSVFRHVPPPHLSSRLLQLGESTDENIFIEAINALANITDEKVRSLAIKLFKERPVSVESGSLQLLMNNYRKGDFRYIETLIRDWSDADIRLVVALDILKIARKADDEEFANLILWVYEKHSMFFMQESSGRTSFQVGSRP